MRALLASLFLLTGCVSTVPPYVHLPAPRESKGVRVETSRVVRRPHRFEGIRGQVENQTDKWIESCRIIFQVYDHESRPLTKARVTIDDLAPREIRNFDARFDKLTRDVRTIDRPEIRTTFASSERD